MNVKALNSKNTKCYQNYKKKKEFMTCVTHLNMF